MDTNNKLGEIISECYYTDHSDEDWYIEYIKEPHEKEIKNIADTLLILKDLKTE